MAREKSLLPRRFRIGSIVQTKSGVKGKVIGSTIYGVYQGKPTPSAWVEYRIKPFGKQRTFYRRESELQKARRR